MTSMKTSLTMISLLMIVTSAVSPQALAAKTVKKMTATDLELCLEKNQSNMGMVDCANKEYLAQDKILNDTYAQLLKDLKTDNSEDSQEILIRIVKAERAWINFRDASCDVAGLEMLGGSGEGLVVLSCLAQMTTERVKAVKDMGRYAPGAPDRGM